MFAAKYFNNIRVVYKNMIYGSYKMNYSQQHSPRRAILYVPGNSEKKLKKAYSLHVDCIAMDCEDGVAANQKEAARSTIHNLLNEGKPSKAIFDWAVRVNSIDSGLCDDDLSAVLNAKNLPDSILLPKIENTEHIKWFSEKLKKYIKHDKKVNLIMMTESAKSLLNLKEICQYTTEKSKKFTPTSIIFGSDDFCANIGAVRTESQIEILYARQKVILVAKAFGLQAIDMVYINYKDLDGLRKQCEQGMRMGYTGKQVIHPDQIPVVQTSFLPSEEQVKWARDLIKKFKEHEKSGVGAFTFRGSMIDMPTLRIAENIMKLIETDDRKK